MAGGVLRLAVAIAAVAVTAATSRHGARPESVLLVTLGEVDQRRIESAIASLEENYYVKVRVESRGLPQEARYAPRNRYRAERILDFLEREYPTERHVMALTAADISTTGRGREDWGVCGLGRISGRSAVVSTYRLRSRRAARLDERLKKAVLHEFGHNAGLRHCKASETCPMQDANGRVRTIDRSEDALCDACVDKVSYIASGGKR